MQVIRNARGANMDGTIRFIAIGANQTINVGDLLQIDSTSRKGVAAVAASTTIVGIAQEAITTGTTVTDKDVIPVQLVRGMVVRTPFSTSGTKKTFAPTDKYTTAYDISNKTTLNPDDTTGGMCNVQDYDNTAATVDVIFTDASQANVG